MAAHGDSHGDYTPGTMDISEHVKAWAGFTAFVKWSAIGIGLIMIGLALFRTHG
ncbi:MAG TPA: aa3-type cytochrome c oxidase subunit IV [Rhizomicrobium sp.]